jgi:hypothetical protein
MLAARIAGLRIPQIRTLREHLEGRHNPKEQSPDRPPTDARAVGELSFQEWRTLSRACAVLALRDGPLLKDSILREVGETDPELAVKLGRFGELALAALCERVKSGKRCP